MAREIVEIAHRGENLPRPARHLSAGLGEADLARPPLHQFDP